MSVCSDPASGAKELGRLVRQAAARAIAERGSFALVLSGGSLVDALASSLDDDDDGGGEKAPRDTSKWHAFWADERLVPGDSPDSNAGGAKVFLEKVSNFGGCYSRVVGAREKEREREREIEEEKREQEKGRVRRKTNLSLLPLSLPFQRQTGIPKANVHALADPPAACPHDAAKEYEARLRALPRGVLPVDGESEMPKFDLVLLGVGPDGHVASLFPGLPAVDVDAASGRWVVGVEGSPKPPPLRVSLTLPAIASAREILIVAFGAGKGDIVREALVAPGKEGEEAGPSSPLLPVQRVEGARWLIDAAAARGLETK